LDTGSPPLSLREGLVAMTALLAIFLGFGLLWGFPRSRRFARGLTLFVLCAVLLSALLFLDSAAWACRFTLLDPAFHRAVFREVGMYPALSRTLARAVPGMLGGSLGLGSSQRKEAEGLLGACVADAVTPEWVERELGRVVEGVFGYLEGSRHAPDLAIDLREPKARAVRFLAGAKGTGRVLAELRKAVARIPDEVTSGSVPQVAQVEAALSRLRPGVQVALLVGPVGMAVVGVLALLAWLVAGRGRAARAWLGAGLFEAGGAVVVLGLVARPVLLQFTAGLNLPPQFGDLPVRAWLEAVAFRLLRVWQVAGAGVVAVGILLVAAPLLAGWKRAPRSLPAAGPGSAD